MTPRPGVVRPASFRAIARSLSKPTHAEASHASFLDHAWSGAVPWRPDVRGRHGSRQADYRGWLARRRRVTASTCRSLLVALVAGVARHQSDWRLWPACGCPCGRSWRASVVAKTQGAALATRGRCAHSRRPGPWLNQVYTAIEDAAKRGKTNAALPTVDDQRRTVAGWLGARRGPRLWTHRHLGGHCLRHHCRLALAVSPNRSLRDDGIAKSSPDSPLIFTKNSRASPKENDCFRR
jgi:hypothetical protein